MKHLLLLAAFLGIAGTARPSAAQVTSIQEFVEQQPRWKDLAGTSWTIEGRYSLIGQGRILFVNCPMPFLFSTHVERVRSPSRVLQVKGTLQLRNSDLIFDVEQMVSRPSDLEALQARRKTIKAEIPDDWYRVADWAENRGRFYEDDDLLQAARTLNLEGLMAEFQSWNPASIAGFQSVLEKARTKELGSLAIPQLSHHGLQKRHRFLQSQPFRERDVSDLLALVAANLPGALKNLQTLPADTEKYRNRPEEIYVSANASHRLELDRVFYLDVLAERFLNAMKTSSNPSFEQIDQFARSAPERTDLIGKYEAEAIESRLKVLPSLTRSQLSELTSRLKRRQEEERATQATREWLLAREPLMRTEGARALADLAEQWIALLDDQAAAARLYMEVWKENPTYAPASEWLRNNGYVLRGNQWIAGEELPQQPKTRLEIAIEQGRVEAGMTAVQVRAALGVIPLSVTRVASAGAVEELWLYDRMMIRLVRKAGATESRVVSVESRTIGGAK